MATTIGTIVVVVAAVVLFGGAAGAQSGNTVRGFVFDDVDGNGRHDIWDEPGAADVVVELIDGAGDVIARATTTTGAYEFTGLPPDSYRIRVTPPEGVLFSPDDHDSDVDPTTGESAAVKLGGKGETAIIEAGVVVDNGVSGFVWEDENANGRLDYYEEGPLDEELQVFLVDAATSTVIDTTTTVNGRYAFTSTGAGDFTVAIIQPPETIWGPQNVGDDQDDSDVGPSGKASVSIGIGSYHAIVDGGLVVDTGVRGRVWEDADGNGGRWYGDDDGIEGVTVELRTTSGILLQSTVTSASGAYDLGPRRAGTYVVRVIRPVGAIVTAQDAASDDGDDSDIDPATASLTVTLDADNPHPRIDAGLVIDTGVRGHVWEDPDANGRRWYGDDDGIEGVTVELRSASGALLRSTVTSAWGGYDFGPTEAGTYTVHVVLPAGAFVTAQDADPVEDEDSDIDPATASLTVVVDLANPRPQVDAGLVLDNGFRGIVFDDPGADGARWYGDDDGIGGVLVYLQNEAGVRIAKTVTDASGHYSFGPVGEGTFRIEVVTPAGVTGFSPQNVHLGNDVETSDVDATGLSPWVDIGPGQALVWVLAGIVP